jgi:hypothetical protein
VWRQDEKVETFCSKELKGTQPLYLCLTPPPGAKLNAKRVCHLNGSFGAVLIYTYKNMGTVHGGTVPMFLYIGVWLVKTKVKLICCYVYSANKERKELKGCPLCFQ